MKKGSSLIVAILLFILAGCATANITKTTNVDGSESCSAKYSALLRTYDGVNMSACGAKGGAENVGVDQALSQALLGALAKGLQK